MGTALTSGQTDGYVSVVPEKLLSTASPNDLLQKFTGVLISP